MAWTHVGIPELSILLQRQQFLCCSTAQVPPRHNPRGDSNDTESERGRARMYMQALLDEVSARASTAARAAAGSAAAPADGATWSDTTVADGAASSSVVGDRDVGQPARTDDESQAAEEGCAAASCPTGSAAIDARPDAAAAESTALAVVAGAALIDQPAMSVAVQPPARVIYKDWVDRVANLGEDQMQAEVGTVVCDQLLRKVEAGEKWTNLPADAHGGPIRSIASRVPHIISMTLRADLITARKGGWVRPAAPPANCCASLSAAPAPVQTRPYPFR
jgi:hypothetical protein